MEVWRKQCNEWLPPPPPLLLLDWRWGSKNGKGVGVWWSHAVSLEADQRPLSLFVQMTSSFYYPIYQTLCCPQSWSSFFSTDPTLNQWLAWNFTEAAGSNELVKASQQTLKLLLCCRSPLSSNMSLSNFLSSSIPTGFVMHQEKEKERKLQIPVLTQFCFICS